MSSVELVINISVVVGYSPGHSSLTCENISMNNNYYNQFDCTHMHRHAAQMQDYREGVWNGNCTLSHQQFTEMEITMFAINFCLCNCNIVGI